MHVRTRVPSFAFSHPSRQRRPANFQLITHNLSSFTLLQNISRKLGEWSIALFQDQRISKYAVDDA